MGPVELPEPTDRDAAFALIATAVNKARGVLHAWEVDALHALVSNLARQSPTVAADRQRYGFVR